MGVPGVGPPGSPGGSRAPGGVPREAPWGLGPWGYFYTPWGPIKNTFKNNVKIHLPIDVVCSKDFDNESEQKIFDITKIDNDYLVGNLQES